MSECVRWSGVGSNRVRVEKPANRKSRGPFEMPLYQSIRHATTAIKVGMLVPGLRVIHKSRLLVINTTTSSAVYAVGDICQQKLEGRESLDWARTSRMAVVGLLTGVLNHYWLGRLDAWLPGRRAPVVLKKVIADQLVSAPICCSLFFIGE